jgi:hypothetical protein
MVWNKHCGESWLKSQDKEADPEATDLRYSYNANFIHAFIVFHFCSFI